jgi:enoyl-CoA hydratase
MGEPVLRVSSQEGVATLTLNRPEKRNALSRELRGALVRAFTELGAAADVGGVILTGAGPGFCAGLDLAERCGETDAPGGLPGGRTDEDVVGAMERFDRPILGAINGVAITGGFELALACDLLIASRQARFADTHARVGILPSWGLSQKLSRLIGLPRAKELSLTGNFLPAEQAAAWGLVNRVVEPDELLPTCAGLARDILSCVPEAVRGYKRVIDAGFARPYGEARQLEREHAAAHAGSVTADAIRERRDGIQARGRSQKT